MIKTLAVLALCVLSLVDAQSLSDLPQCGQTCISNMFNIATSQFGCAVGNVTCYCTVQDFGYGVRDCANEACNQQDAAEVISFGAAYCENALSSFSLTATTATHTSPATTGSRNSTISRKNTMTSLMRTARTTHGTPSPNPSPNASKPSPTPSLNPPKGLSTGASIGIGIAIAVAAIVACGAIFLLWRRRSRRTESKSVVHESPVQRRSGSDTVQRIHEKDSKNIVGEMSTKANTHELHAPPTELEGS